MKVFFNKRFLKDLKSIPTKDRKRIEDFVFDEIKLFSSFYSIPGIEKLTGHFIYYKIRFGNYRIGLSFQNDELTFERVLDRKEIYRYFP